VVGRPFEEIEREQIAFGNTSDDDCGEHIPYKMQNDRICNGFRCHGKIGKSQAGSPHIENHEPFPCSTYSTCISAKKREQAIGTRILTIF
jgi:hypothetical protein